MADMEERREAAAALDAVADELNFLLRRQKELSQIAVETPWLSKEEVEEIFANAKRFNELLPEHKKAWARLAEIVHGPKT